MAVLNGDNKRDATPTGYLKAPSQETKVDWISWAWNQVSSETVSNGFNIYKRYIQTSNAELVPEVNPVDILGPRLDAGHRTLVEKAKADPVPGQLEDVDNVDGVENYRNLSRNGDDVAEDRLTQEEENLIADLSSRPIDSLFLGYEIVLLDEP